MGLTAKKVYAVLNRKIKKISGDVSSLGTPLFYAGSVTTADLLPLSPKLGAVYNIEQKSIYGEPGTNVVWNGVLWDALGPTFDLSLLLTKENAKNLYLQKNQGSENSGKFLVVGEDGNVILSDAQDGGVKTDTTLTKSGEAADAKIVGDKITTLKEDLDDLHGALTPFYTSVDLGSAIAGAVSKSDGSIIETGDVYHYRIPVTEGQKFVLSAWNAYSAYKAWLWLRKDGTVHSFYRNDSTYKQYTESVMVPCDGTLVIQQPYGHIPEAYILDGYRYSNLYQKKIYANGDSIMAGVGGVSFINQIASKHNMTLDNVAVGGTTFVTSNSNSITSRVLSMSGEFDYIIIEGGYNDVFGNSPIGTLTTNYSDSFDSATVLGAVETICKHLRVNYSSSKILFVLGHRQSGIGLSNPRLDTMWDAIITALNKWSMPYVDIRKEGTLMAYNSEWLSSYFGVGEAEGTHPNTLGYKLFYVPLVEAKLETL